MKKLIPVFLLTLTLVTGCGTFDYENGNALLIQTDANQPPYSVRVISKTPNGYNVEVYQTGKVCVIPESCILQQIKDVGTEEIAVAKWTREKTDVKYIAEKKEELSTQRKMLWCGFVPMVLVLLCYVHGGFSLLAIPYMLGGCIVMPTFVFLSIFFFFTIISVISILLISFLITAGSPDNPVGLTISFLVYLVFFIGMVL